MTCKEPVSGTREALKNSVFSHQRVGGKKSE